MTREIITENHLRLLKEAQDKMQPDDRGRMHAFLFVFAVAAVCNALLAVATAVRERS